MSAIEKQIVHCWKPMEKYEFKNMDEFEDWIEGEINDRIKVMKNMQPNQYMMITFLQGSVRIFNSIINNLREHGLDIGKGNCEYGYRMPLPNNGKAKTTNGLEVDLSDYQTQRELIIFRRHL